MPPKSYRIVASILAIPLAAGAALIVRAHAVSPHHGSSADANASSTAPSGDVPAPATDAGALGRLLVVSPDGTGAGLPMYSTAGTTASVSSWIKSRYPKQAAATQTSDPATKHWALLIGLNDYAGSTADNVGSRQDAQTLQSVLLRAGWRQDHIILIADRDGTASHIIEGIRWLASKTDSSSTAVFHYSGHENWFRSSADRDDTREIEIWAADNRMITETTVGNEFNRIHAGHMWIDFATCRAAGFDEPGMVKSGRILTFSSNENQYSYEDPKLHHSVFGWFLIDQSLYQKKGNTNHDNTITIEEAFTYAKSNTYSYTDGAQRPVMIDKTSGAFSLRIPPPPKPAPQPSSGSAPVPSTSPKTCIVVCF